MELEACKTIIGNNSLVPSRLTEGKESAGNETKIIMGLRSTHKHQVTM